MSGFQVPGFLNKAQTFFFFIAATCSVFQSATTDVYYLYLTVFSCCSFANQFVGDVFSDYIRHDYVNNQG